MHASPDEGMERVGVGHPANEARVRRQRNDSIACNAQVPLSCRSVIGQHVVDQAKQLHHSLILPQILMTLHRRHSSFRLWGFVMLICDTLRFMMSGCCARLVACYLVPFAKYHHVTA